MKNIIKNSKHLFIELNAGKKSANQESAIEFYSEIVHQYNQMQSIMTTNLTAENKLQAIHNILNQ